MVKSKLSPQSGSSLETVEPHPQKEAIKLKVFFFNVNIFKQYNLRINKTASLLS